MKKFLCIILISLIQFGCGGEELTTAPLPDVLTLTNIGTRTATIDGQALSFSVSGTDPDGLSLSYSTDGTVGSGSDPYNMGAQFNANSGTFTWNVSNVTAGNYFVEFTVSNTNSITASETVQIIVQMQPAQPGQFELGLAVYNTDCERCHGPGGIEGSSAGIIQCMDAVTYDEKINGGSMTSYASTWSASDEAAVLFYLNNVDPTRC